MTGHGSIEEEREAALEIIEIIEEDDSLSLNKRKMLSSIVEGSILAIINLIEVPRERIKVEIKRLNEDAIIPQYAHKTDAGADVFAVEEVTLKPHETALVKTGIAVAIPVGYEIQVRPRSGLSLKTNLRVANAPGTIDSDYRGEICVIMTNIGNLSYTINKGDKIAQLIIAPVPMIDWVMVEELSSTERGEGGFGSTDKK
jgi:dUTP pyrophosphatase